MTLQTYLCVTAFWVHENYGYSSILFWVYENYGYSSISVLTFIYFDNCIYLTIYLLIPSCHQYLHIYTYLDLQEWKKVTFIYWIIQEIDSHNM